MCVVSNIGDSWKGDFPIRYPGINQDFFEPNVTRTDLDLMRAELQNEIEKLRKEIKALKKLLKAAQTFDEETGQKDCEMDDKIAFIKKAAELVGVDMKDVFP